MNIQGLQKLTLLDFPEHVACTIFTGGCQLDCPFCHNSELIAGPFAEGIGREEVLTFLKKRQGLLDGVAITGGEPMIQADLEAFIRDVKAMGYQVKLDTNGGFPEKLRHLIDEGLIDYVAMDIKNVPEKYGITCGIENLDVSPYIQSKELLQEGRVAYEFRTTIVRQFHTNEDIINIAKWLKGAKRYYLQGFVDRDQVRDRSLSAYTEAELEEILKAAKVFLPCTEIRGL